MLAKQAPSEILLHPITLKDYPFKEHKHEKTTSHCNRRFHQPAIDGC